MVQPFCDRIGAYEIIPCFFAVSLIGILEQSATYGHEQAHQFNASLQVEKNSRRDFPLSFFLENAIE